MPGKVWKRQWTEYVLSFYSKRSSASSASSQPDLTSTLIPQVVCLSLWGCNWRHHTPAFICTNRQRCEDRVVSFNIIQPDLLCQRLQKTQVDSSTTTCIYDYLTNRSQFETVKVCMSVPVGWQYFGGRWDPSVFVAKCYLVQVCDGESSFLQSVRSVVMLCVSNGLNCRRWETKKFF